MKNTKEKAIKEAYGDTYEWDENGWLYYGADEGSEFGYEPFGEYDKKNENDGVFEWRPKKLSGIENNNGWIKIESETDLPKDGFHWTKSVFAEWEDQQTHWEDMNHNFHTHYQPIAKPLPPIY